MRIERTGRAAVVSLSVTYEARGRGIGSAMLRRAALTILLAIVAPILAQSQNSGGVQLRRADAMIPMRDGTRLFTAIVRPAGVSGALPFLITRTPYGADANAKGLPDNQHKEFIADGYILVFQDIRGRNRSEGTFIMLRIIAYPLTQEPRTANRELRTDWHFF